MPAEIRLPRLVPIQFTVLHASKAPSSDELAGWLRAELEAEADPLRSEVRNWLEQGLIRFESVPRSELSLPPTALFRYLGLSGVDEATLEGSTQALTVLSGDLPVGRRVGLWAGLFASRRIARRLEGVVHDVSARRVVASDTYGDPLPPQGGFAVSEHILIPTSSQDDGYWLTTVGMSKFGLPNLEVVGVPRHLVQQTQTVLNGCAQALAEWLDRSLLANADRETLPLEVLEVTAGAVARGNGSSVRDEGPTVRVGVSLQPGGADREPLVRISAPDDAELGVFLNELFAALFGHSEANIRDVSSDDEEMTAAKQRAIAEFDTVRARFEAGFPVGTALYLKVGFDSPDGGKEYMWVGVEAWTGSLVQGRLANDPQFVSELKAGQTVRVLQGEACDWLIAHPNGEREGGYTVDVLASRS